MTGIPAGFEDSNFYENDDEYYGSFDYNEKDYEKYMNEEDIASVDFSNKKIKTEKSSYV